MARSQAARWAISLPTTRPRHWWGRRRSKRFSVCPRNAADARFLLHRSGGASSDVGLFHALLCAHFVIVDRRFILTPAASPHSGLVLLLLLLRSVDQMRGVPLCSPPPVPHQRAGLGHNCFC